MRPAKIISGGQTGVDRGALEAARALGLPLGGHCPRGRRAEDGKVPYHFDLTETGSSDYDIRTYLNVKNADATLVLCRESEPSGGTASTIKHCEAMKKPYLVLNLYDTRGSDLRSRAIDDFLRRHKVGVLNVAGPRETKAPGIQAETREILSDAFRDPPHEHGGTTAFSTGSDPSRVSNA